MRLNRGWMKWSMVGRVALTTITALAVPLAVAASGTARATGEIYTNRNASAPPVSVDAAAAPVHDPAKPTAVIVLSLEGTNVADALAPYEVLADAGAFNLYTVAERREPVPMTGGVDVIPDLSFGQLTDRLHGTPDVIVVPQLTMRASRARRRSSNGCSGKTVRVIRCWSACVSAPKCWPPRGWWRADPLRRMDRHVRSSPTSRHPTGRIPMA
jgi:hypothetical protein